jgi:hypothetical protein
MFLNLETIIFGKDEIYRFFAQLYKALFTQISFNMRMLYYVLLCH